MRACHRVLPADIYHFFNRKDLVAVANRDGQVMSQEQSLIEIPLNERIDELLQRFGGWRIVLALLEGLLRRRTTSNSISGLPPRMLRDIGLPLDEELGPRRLSLWDLRV